MKLKKIIDYVIESFSKSKNEILELNGIRAIAIILVMFHHSFLAYKFTNLLSIKADNYLLKFFFKILENGRIGVDIFFVLSGFLIGGQLLKEIKTTGTLNFKKFYFKRILRIFPAYYFALILVTIFFIEKISIKEIISHLFYLQNYWLNIYEITWSLAVEEQFYIFLPFLLFIFRKNFKNANCFCFAIFGLLIILPFYFRLLIFKNLHNIYDTQYISLKIFGAFHTRFDQLFIGVFIAFLYLNYKNLLINKYKIFYFLQFFLFIIFCFLIYYSGMNGSFYKIVLQFSLIGLVVGFFILSMLLTKTFFNKILSNNFFYFIAKISYPMYLYHYFSIWSIHKEDISLTNNEFLNFFIYLTAIFALSVLFALLSWLFIEYPFLKIKQKKCKFEC
ncbi:MAG TPA: acyltransferase [bacterium]|nr:acyltransferase [bacterium]